MTRNKWAITRSYLSQIHSASRRNSHIGKRPTLYVVANLTLFLRVSFQQLQDATFRVLRLVSPDMIATKATIAAIAEKKIERS